MDRSRTSRVRDSPWNSSSARACCSRSSRRPSRGKEPGEKVSFTLEPKDGYGELIAEAIVDLPKHIFMVDGKLAEDILFVGSQVPMSDSQGNRMMGTVKEVGDEHVKMDFNHPMAGKTLHFDVEVVSVRDVTPETCRDTAPAVRAATVAATAAATTTDTDTDTGTATATKHTGGPPGPKDVTTQDLPRGRSRVPVEAMRTLRQYLFTLTDPEGSHTTARGDYPVP